jgi:hypothetical protein
MAWPTAADVQARTGIACSSGSGSDETSYGLNVTTLLERARAYAAEVCGRKPEYGFDETGITDETYDYTGQDLIFVSHPPIVAVSSVELDDSALSATNDEYYVYDKYIRLGKSREYGLEIRDPYLGIPRGLEISYTGGYSDADGTHKTIPSELKEIILEIASRWLLKIDERYRTDKNASKLTIGEYTAEFPDPEKDMADLINRLYRGEWNLRVWR